MSASFRVAVTRRIPKEGMRLLEDSFELLVHDSASVPSRDELVALLSDADAALTLLSDNIDDSLLAECPKLKIIANMAVGHDNVDLEAARRRGVIVTNTPGVLTDSTADLAMALILAVTRRLVESDAFMRAGNYQQWDPRLLRGMELGGKKLGVFGFGRIGQAVARRARAFGMQILYTNRSKREDAAEDLAAERVSKEDLVRRADVISVHSAYAEALHHSFGEQEFSSMKKSAYFINTARGPLMDEAALLAALQKDEIAGAGLDVYEREPAFEAGLAELSNVVMLPHIGSATMETRDAMATLAAENIVSVLAGNSALTPVN